MNTEIVHIKATDSDERAKLSYSIHGSVDLVSMRMFRIDVGTGVLYTADVLDYETCTQHILTIMVRKNQHLHSPKCKYMLAYSAIYHKACDSVIIVKIIGKVCCNYKS